MNVDDPFAVLGLPHAYRIDRARLERAYLEKSAAAHPDMQDGGGGDGDDAASSALNAARERVLDPEKRAIALLRVLAARARVQMTPADERALPDGFLMEMMEVREQMEADRARHDPVLMERWRAWAGERRMGHQHQVATLFAVLAHDPDGGAGNINALRAVRLELNAWRYIERMIEQVEGESQRQS